jgi:hypothetical protein
MPKTRRQHSRILDDIELAAWNARWLCDHQGQGDLQPHMVQVTAELVTQLLEELVRARHDEERANG